jgi:small subunit ribosomal protein S8
MSLDPVADMLCILSNANHKFHERVDLPASKLKKEIARVLKGERYISDYKLLQDKKQGTLRIFMKYAPNKTRVIQGIKRISRPGLRVYREADNLSRVRGGLGMSIVSTPKGLMTDHEARKGNLGGEVLAQVW